MGWLLSLLVFALRFRELLRMILTASWLLPISDPQIKEGAVVIQGNRILAVGAMRAICSAYPDEAVRSFDNAILLPGFINSHSHLDYAIFRGLFPSLPFIQWIRQLVELKYASLKREDFSASSQVCLMEGIKAGITFYADTSDLGTSFNALLESGVRGIYFHEVFGPREEDSGKTMQSLQRTLEGLQAKSTSLVSVGIAPHAPYTVSEPLLRKISGFLEENPLPLSMHVAESKEEVRFIANGDGPIADWHRGRGIPCRAHGLSPIQYLLETGILNGSSLRQLVHVTQATEEDLALLKRSAVSVALCPRSNARLGVGTPPFALLRGLGIPLGIGTDSVASSDTLSLFEEMRFLALVNRLEQNATVASSPKELIDAVTLSGARALGMDSVIGSIEPGKLADLIVISLDGPSTTPTYDPYHALVYCCSPSNVYLTMVDGKILYDSAHDFSDDRALRASVEKTARHLQGCISFDLLE